MERLLSLKADILCEGHFGVFLPNSRVTEYIERYLEEYGNDCPAQDEFLGFGRWRPDRYSASK